MIRPPSIPNRRAGAPRKGSQAGLPWALLVAFLALGSAGGIQVSSSFLDRYDFSREGGKQEKLPRVLEEISGLAVTEAGHVLAHNDERAVIYQLDPPTGEVIKAFSAGIGGIRGDFEGIASAGSRLFLMTSSGQILETREGADGDAVSYRMHRTGLEALCEFEGLAYDAHTHSLLLPCKETRTREFASHLVVLEVKLDPVRPYPVPRIFIPLQELEAMDLGDTFHPSAVEIHPGTGGAVLISAREETILETSAQGTLVGGRELRRKSHPQPEGVTFLPDGTLLLADEGQGKRGRLTRYELVPADSAGPRASTAAHGPPELVP